MASRRSAVLDPQSNGWKPLARPATLDHLRAHKKPVYEDVEVCLDAGLADDYNRAGEALDAAKARLSAIQRMQGADDATVSAVAAGRLKGALDDVEQATAAYDAARDAVEPVLVTFRVRALRDHILDEMKVAHPPTDEQVEEHRVKFHEAVETIVSALPEDKREEQRRGMPYAPLDVNPDTYPAALLAACCVVPEMSEEEATELLDNPDWSDAELGRLIAACHSVQRKVPQVNLGKGSGRTPGSK